METRKCSTNCLVLISLGKTLIMRILLYLTILCKFPQVFFLFEIDVVWICYISGNICIPGAPENVVEALLIFDIR